MTNKANMFIDHSTNSVVTTDEFGAEIFREPKTEQNISIAHTLYMYHKYHAQDKRCEND